jgi:hypothetical protein
MLISVSRLLAVLADRLDTVAPPPFTVRAKGTDLLIDHPQTWWVWLGFGWIEDETESRSNAQLGELVIRSALNQLQDTVSEASKEPWPGQSPTTMAPANVRTDGESLFFWYGASESSPVIGFEPITLKDVARS